jgi:predicted molibdopterin-dependent oxidoreductase YjgC
VALPDWEILARVGRALGARDAVYAAPRPDQVFGALAAALPPFRGMSYRALGDGGLEITP